MCMMNMNKQEEISSNITRVEDTKGRHVVGTNDMTPSSMKNIPSISNSELCEGKEEKEEKGLTSEPPDPEIEQKLDMAPQVKESEMEGNELAQLDKNTWTLDKCPDLDSAVLLHTQLNDTAPLGSTLSYLTSLSLLRFEETGNLGDLDLGLSFAAKGVEVCSQDKEANTDTLRILFGQMANLYSLRFNQRGSSSDIDNSILSWRQGLDLTPNDHAARVAILVNLADLLNTRFQHLASVQDLEEAITLHRQAVDLTPDSQAKKPIWLNNLARAYLSRYQRLGEPHDIDEAIRTHQRAVVLTPDDHIRKPTRLNDFADSLSHRFRLSGDLQDLKSAIDSQEHALKLIADDHPEKFTLLNNLGTMYTFRFARLGEVQDIDAAITYQEQAIDLVPDSMKKLKHTLLGNMGTTHLQRFTLLGATKDLDLATTYHRQAVALTPDDSPDKFIILTVLGASLKARFDHLGEVQDVEDAIATYQQALGLIPPGHIQASTLSSNFGGAYRSRYSRTGELQDIDNAIKSFRRAIDLTPSGHPLEYNRLNGLGLAYSDRFDHLREPHDLENAIKNLRRAVDVVPPDHPDKPRLLDSLGGAYHTRFQDLGQPQDLEHAIDFTKKAVELAPDNYAMRFGLLSNLGAVLQDRFNHRGILQDLNAAMFVKQQAINLTPDRHSSKPIQLLNLAQSFISRFSHTKDLQDLRGALSCFQYAMSLTPDGHAFKAELSLTFGQFMFSCFKLFGKEEDFSKAVTLFREAAKSATGPPLFRFKAAVHWAISLDLALEPYYTVMTLVPQVVWLGKTIQQRYADVELIKYSDSGPREDAVTEAAAVACIAGEYELALKWLEQGRSIIWSQILHIRSPVEALEAVEPGLAHELSKCSAALNTAAGTGDKDGPPLDESAEERHQLARKWEELLEQARSIEGFSDFLRPKEAEMLKRAARDTIIIVINAGSKGCDALILRPDVTSIERVQLSSLSPGKTKSAQDKLYQSLRSAGMRYRSDDTERQSVPSLKASARGPLPNILKMLWFDVAQPILNHLGYTSPPTGELPHVTWCLTGAMVSLPVHAAGLYGEADGPESKLFSYIVSSYTPSLTSFLETAEKVHHGPLSVLAITQPETPNMTPLPGTTREINAVEKQLKNSKHSFTKLDREQATVASVSQALDSHNWVHFSCHANQDADDPTKSAFHFHDGPLELARIMKKPLKHAQLAYLSACQTAAGDIKVPDETIHLAAGMFIAGYRTVIATLWSIGDREAPEVASAFYERLLADSAKRPAYALHHAVSLLREKHEKDLLSWVPYIHMGH